MYKNLLGENKTLVIDGILTSKGVYSATLRKKRRKNQKKHSIILLRCISFLIF